MLRYIHDIDARNVCGGSDSCGGGQVCDPASVFEHQPSNQGKSPTGTKPANKSGTTSSTSSQSTHS